MEFQVIPPPNAARYLLWFTYSTQIYAKATQQARRMATAIFEPRFALGGWARRPRTAQTQPLQVQYDIPFLNPWLCKSLRISDFIHTKESEVSPDMCIVYIDPQSRAELAILPALPANSAATVETLELRIVAEVLPKKNYRYYWFNFSSLLQLAVPSLIEVRISLDLVDSTICDPLRRAQAHLNWPLQLRNAWREHIGEVAMNEVKRLARSTLGGQQQVQVEEVIHTYEADDFGQSSRLLIVKK